MYFEKALEFSIKNKKTKLLSFGWNDSQYELFYNCGIQSMMKKSPETALQFFAAAAEYFNNTPLLWIRMAQCCLLIEHKQRNIQQPFGKFRFYSDFGNYFIADQESKSSNSNDFLSASIRYSQNAIILIEDSGIANDYILNSVYLSIAYAYLSSNNPLSALSIASKLIQSETAAKIHVYFAYFYASQCHVLLNKPKLAIDHLKKCETILSAFSQSVLNAFMEKHSLFNFNLPEHSLQISIFHTYAISFILIGEYSQASAYLEKMSSISPLHPSTRNLKLYLHMKTSKSTSLFQSLMHKFK
jgi:tetratricopeptide (TPR) repeat protein